MYINNIANIIFCNYLNTCTYIIMTLYYFKLLILVLLLKLTITVTGVQHRPLRTTQPRPTINSQQLLQQLILLLKHIIKLRNLHIVRPAPILALLDKPLLQDKLKLIRHLAQLINNLILRKARLTLRDTQLRLRLPLHHQLQQIVSCLLVLCYMFISPKKS